AYLTTALYGGVGIVKKAPFVTADNDEILPQQARRQSRTTFGIKIASYKMGTCVPDFDGQIRRNKCNELLSLRPVWRSSCHSLRRSAALPKRSGATTARCAI